MQESRIHLDNSWGFSILTVKNLDKKKDAGTYKCIVHRGNKTYTENLNVDKILGEHPILEVNETRSNLQFLFNKIDMFTGSQDFYINLIASNILETKINAESGVLVAKYAGYPKPILNWRDPNGTIITDGGYIYTDERLTQLTLSNAKFGNYTLLASNGQLRKEKQIRLIDYIVKPKLTTTLYHNDQGIIAKCEVRGHPKSTVNLEACFEYPSNNNHRLCHRLNDGNLVSN